MAIASALCFLIAFVSYIKHLSKVTNQNSGGRHRLSVFVRSMWTIVTDEMYALDSVGKDSVYSFFLSRSVIGWIVALVTVGVQWWIVSPLCSF